MFITALEYFQGSQRRSVGIAALTVIRDRRQACRSYRDTTRQLFYSQLLYLYKHASNRWQEHEISNIVVMTSWLFDDKYLGPLPGYMKEPLLTIMEAYRSQDLDKLAPKAKEHGSKSAVTRLQDCIRDDWNQSSKAQKSPPYYSNNQPLRVQLTWGNQACPDQWRLGDPGATRVRPPASRLRLDRRGRPAG